MPFSVAVVLFLFFVFFKTITLDSNLLKINFYDTLGCLKSRTAVNTEKFNHNMSASSSATKDKIRQVVKYSSTYAR